MHSTILRRSILVFVLMVIVAGTSMPQPSYASLQPSSTTAQHGQFNQFQRTVTGSSTSSFTESFIVGQTTLPRTMPVSGTLPLTPTATINSPSTIPITLTPSPTPSPSSSEAQRALAFITQREKIPAEQLVIESESRRDEALLGRSFQVVTVMHRHDGRFFIVLVDRTNGVFEELQAVNARVQHARSAKYGKLQPALYERLQQIQSTEIVTVTIFVSATSSQGLHRRMEVARATLAAKYPEVREALIHKRQIMDVADPTLAKRIYKTYRALLDAAIPSIVQPLHNWLVARGYQVSDLPGLPAMIVAVPKRVIASLVLRPDVGGLSLMEESPVILAGNGLAGSSLQAPSCTLPYTCSPNDTNRAPQVWGRGIDGTGVKVALLEAGRVDFTTTSSECPSGGNCFRHTATITETMRIPGIIQIGLDDDRHATAVASIAASDHTTYKGVAPGASI